MSLFTNDRPPKKPLTPFFLYKFDLYDDLKKAHPDSKVTEITMMIAKKWQGADQETKRKYEQRHNEERMKYEQELRAFEEKHGKSQPKSLFPFPVKELAKPVLPIVNSTEAISEEEDNNKKSKNQEKPLPPRRPLSGFFLFKDDIFNEVKQANPDAKMTDITKIFSQRWDAVDSETKQKYEQRYQENKMKYQQEVKAYEEKYGSLDPKFFSSRLMKQVVKPLQSSLNSSGVMSEEEKEDKVPSPRSIYQNVSSMKPQPPRRPLTAFFLFKDEIHDQVLRENPDKSMVEKIKIVAQRWRDLDQESRNIYQQKNEEAKAKYEQEIKDYEEKYGKIEKKKRKLVKGSQSDDEKDNKPVDNVQNNSTKLVPLLLVKKDKKDKKDQTGAPAKKPLSAFFLFQADVFEDTKKTYPHESLTDILRIIVARWDGLDAKSRKQYERKEKQENKEYSKTLKAPKNTPVKQRSKSPTRSLSPKVNKERKTSIRRAVDSSEDDEQVAKTVPKNAYSLFFDSMLKSVMKANPSKDIIEASCVILNEWRESDEHTRRKFEKKFEEMKDKQHHTKRGTKKTKKSARKWEFQYF